jgi:hypothetical protein
LSIFASSAERDFPHPDQGSNRVTCRASHIAEPRSSYEVHLGGHAAGRIEDLVRNDSTHPRIPEAT